jgi:diacylglycerol kinase family enzyme
MGTKVSKPAQPFPPFTSAAIAAPPVTSEAPPTHVHVIANPKSGGGKGAETASLIQERCHAAGYRVSLLYTQYAGHGKEISAGICARILARSTPAVEGIDTSNIIVGIGGDGTAHEVISGMSYASLSTGKPLLPLCLVPCGTGNTLAMNLGLNSVEDSIAALLSKSVRCIDLLECSHPNDTDVPHLRTPIPAGSVPVDGAGVGSAGATSASAVHLEGVKPEDSESAEVHDLAVISEAGRHHIRAYEHKVLYSCNIFAWGLSTAVLESANNLRWCGGAQYNCAAYGALIGNKSYLSSIEWVRPAAPISIPADTFAATRALIGDSASHVDVPADSRSLVPVHPVSGDVSPLVMIHFQVTCYMGARMAFCPFAKLDDGLMDICAVSPGNRMGLVGVMEAAKDNGRHVLGAASARDPRAAPNVQYAQAEEVIFRPLNQDAVNAWKRGEQLTEHGEVIPGNATPGDAARARARDAYNVAELAMSGRNSVNIDGELVGFSPARLKVLKQALPVLCR